MNIKSFLKKQTYRTNWYSFLTFAIVIDALIFILIGGIGVYTKSHNYKILGEIIINAGWLLLGLPFLVLKVHKESIDKEIKTKKN